VPDVASTASTLAAWSYEPRSLDKSQHEIVMHVLRSTIPLLFLVATQLPAADNAPNPQAIADLKAGQRTDANAAWWGFDEDDSTDAIQAAIDSGAKTVTIPNVGQDWIVRPLRLAGDQELILEPGVVIAAKRGEYRGGGDSVFTARDLDNLTIRGDGATVRMQKEDYISGLVLKNLGWNRWYGQYEKAEWRMCLSLRGCNNVRVEGLTLRDSGGDGIYIDGGKRAPYSSQIHIRNVVCDNNYRQGISVISVDGLVIEDSSFSNTWGTPPSSGIDIEPDDAKNCLQNLLVRNCTFDDNYGDGIEVFLAHLTQDSEPVSIVFEDCRVSSRRGAGIRVTKIADNGPRGEITFRNCTVENTEAYGIKVQDKSVDGASVKFIDCTLRNTANNRNYADSWAPVVLQARADSRTKRYGGIEFVNCSVEDDRDRPALTLPEVDEVFDLTGQIVLRNSKRVESNVGTTPKGWSVELETASE